MPLFLSILNNDEYARAVMSILLSRVDVWGVILRLWLGHSCADAHAALVNTKAADVSWRHAETIIFSTIYFWAVGDADESRVFMASRSWQLIASTSPRDDDEEVVIDIESTRLELNQCQILASRAHELWIYHFWRYSRVITGSPCDDRHLRCRPHKGHRRHILVSDIAAVIKRRA